VTVRCGFARNRFGERSGDVAARSRGGWLETPDRDVAVRHELVWRAHTSFKTGSTRYRLTASAIIFLLSSAGVPISRARSDYNGAIT